MVRDVVAARPRSWMAILAIVIAGGGLLWHILACVESPMAFSPDGKTLAFVTMEPLGDLKEQPRPGEHAFRLMTVSQDRKVRVLEESVNDMLTAPGFSPDGRRLCYVRVPLRSASQLAAVEETARRYEQALDQAARAAASAPSQDSPGPASVPAERPLASQPSPVEDMSLPPVERIEKYLSKARMLEPLICTVVERDLTTGRVVSTTPLAATVFPDMVRYIYGLARPQYTHKADRIFITLFEQSYMLESTSGKTALVATNAAAGALSPDGQTLAILCEDAIQLWSTDGQRSIYFRYEEVSLNGLAWIDAQTLGVLTAKTQSPQGAATQSQPASTQPTTSLLIQRFRTDGSILEPIRILVPEGSYAKETATGDLAISPDGRHIVVAYGKDVFFATSTGRVLKHVHNEEKVALIQPAFAPDSRRVALKQIAEEPDEVNRVTDIVFFSPDGQEQYRVPVPPIQPGTTRPATQPATQPTSQPAVGE
jgi:hypothetical protein